MTVEEDIRIEVTASDLREAWLALSADERAEGFRLLPRHEAEDFFLELRTSDQAQILCAMPVQDRRSWMRLLAPDDAADLIQQVGAADREGLIALLDEPSRKEVSALLAYAEDDAGGLMSPRYARLRPDMTVDEAIAYFRRQARDRIETLYYAYVLDASQKLLGVVSFRDLFTAPPEVKVRDMMQVAVVTAPEEMDQEELTRLFAQHDLVAIPIVDHEGRMKGIVTIDDIVDVVQEEATEDAHKFGGVSAMEEPYLQASFRQMLQKRGGWLAVLFLGEMITASAMTYFEDELARALVLALFVPLIISSGGNSGSQASTLVIRAMALGEVRLRDWWTVMQREVVAGLGLGSLLGFVGFLRVIIWEEAFHIYGAHAMLIGFTVGTSLVGVVMLGTISGSMLPFLLRRMGLDPASASAPFVATLVDVSGLVIYFTVASLILAGTLL